MTISEQHRIIRDLRDHESKMTRGERELFDMLRKRDKDDEDLDLLSKKKLLDMHERYVAHPKPARNPLDALFRKDEP
jgi:hypothetical protein